MAEFDEKFAEELNANISVVDDRKNFKTTNYRIGQPLINQGAPMHKKESKQVR